MAAKPAVRSRDDSLREIIESQTADNWRKKKTAALAMLAQAAN
jgi:hypothetical protein